MLIDQGQAAGGDWGYYVDDDVDDVDWGNVDDVDDVVDEHVDFGYVGMMKDRNGQLRKTYAFVMCLSHSRYRYVEFVTSQDQLSWSQLHINAFQQSRRIQTCENNRGSNRAAIGLSWYQKNCIAPTNATR